MLLAGSGRTLGFRPLSGKSDAFPMNQTPARIYARIYKAQRKTDGTTFVVKCKELSTQLCYVFWFKNVN
ncbi:hypothetical protein HanXRQr2_Chr17g0798071 [Helianthus annuus]|uniref:Uncharacterized protein n=1 Tax=Helianthus annuus TaxID=4232 RepID=A0A251RP32_HELAN|nr:hypothetical protein HanXRQr2_Chr17g0798071 [Helianthus annuus]